MRSCCLAGLPANNAFPLVSHFRVIGALYTCRPDLVGFVNGLPLVVIELKKPAVPARATFDENLAHYKAGVPQLFSFHGNRPAASVRQFRHPTHEFLTIA